MRALLCDVGGVLIQNPWIETSRYMGERFGVESRAVFDLLTRLGRELDADRISLRELQGQVCDGLEVEMPFGDFEEVLGASLKKIPEVWDAVRAIKSSGETRVVALSNMSREVWRTLRSRFDISSLFDSEVLSFELGVLKPEPQIYRTAVGRAGVPPRDCLFVDDLVENVEAAEALGIRTFLAVTPEETASFIRSLVE